VIEYEIERYSDLFCTDCGFWPESFADGLMGVDVRATNQIDAIGYRCEDTADHGLTGLVA
jgi:hypothetical protein